ncbi:hypothetical protein EDD15DRAFT_2358638 [Pisolithus albus]|nr:hypothetical protein EDD15DRAFT_2358638 [Pisolithus albus]
MTALALVAEAVVMTVCAALVTNSADEILLSLGSKISEFPNVALKIYINYSAMIACEWLLFMLAVVAAVRRHQAKLGPVPASWDGVRRLGDIIIQGNVLYFPVCVPSNFISGEVMIKNEDCRVLIYCIVYLVVSLTLPVEWLLGIFGLGVSIAIINGCHLILHVRSAVSQPPTPSPGYVLDEDGLEFASPPHSLFLLK